ncbi:MAG: class I SAM-dependent methyltransferase [Deltaproteobacteria bacterium]|nr:class I SAM-dependent methyltransferase [Deltaproteobacteria bacterium]
MKSEYDFIAKIYDPVLYLVLKPIRIAVMNVLLGYKEKSILDLCCGTGNQLKLLSKNGFKDLHCLDISNSMLEIARKNDSRIKIYNEDATKTYFKNESFDIVIISFALHEKDRITQKSFINEAHRLIKRDGFILIVDYNFDNKTAKLIKIGISIIERIAGKEHYDNFRGYIRNNGLLSLINKDKFTLIKAHKRLFNGVVMSMYQKTISG